MIIPTEVDGVAVITHEQVRSPLSAKSKAPVYFSHAQELLLSNGKTLFCCCFCGHVDEKLGRIRNHQTYDCANNPKVRKGEKMRGVVPAESNPPKRVDPPPTDGDAVLAALEMVLGTETQSRELERVQHDLAVALAEKDEWRRKYVEAERIISKVRERLRGFL